jgi:hypothetical protein
MTKMLLTFLTPLLATTFLQAPAAPPMKMGLWENTSTSKSTEADKTVPRIVRSCVTPTNWLKLMGPTAQGACPKTNEMWAKRIG